MTITEAKAKLVAWCKDQVGYIEGYNNYNKYAPKWAEAGGWDAQNQPWCDIFVDCAFLECFGIDTASRLTYQPKGGFSALCSASAQFYKNNGAYYSSPEVGDQVFFNVSGGINHTGIVIKVGGGIIETIEGNSSDGVRQNAYATGSTYINGYGRPNWGIFSGEDVGPVPEPEPEPKKQTCTVEMTLPYLTQGDKGSWVKIMQIRLMDKGQSLPRWGADGDFGDETRNAVERFQKSRSLVVDSIVGEATWKALGE
jgi:hypothetical protein